MTCSVIVKCVEKATIREFSSQVISGSKISANLALAVMWLSITKINSNLLSSANILAVALQSECWFNSQLPWYIKTHFTSVSNLGAPLIPSVNAVISWPRSTASSHLKQGTFAETGFFPVGIVMTSVVWNKKSDAPLFVPGKPILPSKIGSINIALAVCSPAAWRWGPQPWAI